MLSKNQAELLGTLYAAPHTVADLANSFNGYYDDPDDFGGDRLRQWRFVLRRSLVAMERRGLVERAGMAESISGGPTDDPAIAYAGERVPKGYTRQSVLWRITESGRQAALDDSRSGVKMTPEQVARSNARLEAIANAFSS